jgi:hypothetical protein
VTPSSRPTAVQLGFLTVVQEGGSYFGGYLVTNTWGRPLEFRVSSAVQPNRIQQILYGGTLDDYLCGELIGRTLIEKMTIPVQLVLTDVRPALSLRLRIETPAVWVVPQGVEVPPDLVTVRPASEGRSALAVRPEDAARVPELLAGLDEGLNLSEPFGRVREAVAEARRLGVAGRAA